MEVSEEKQKKLTELLDLNPPSMGRIVHYLSPRSTKKLINSLFFADTYILNIFRFKIIG